MGTEMPTLLIILLIVVVGMILYIVFNARNKAEGAYERVMNLSKDKRFTGGDNKQMIAYLNKIWRGLCADTPVFYSLAANADGSLNISAESVAVNNVIGGLIPMPTGTVFGKGVGVESANFTPIQVTSENKQQVLDIVMVGLDPLNHKLNPQEDDKSDNEYRNELRTALNGIRQCLSRHTDEQQKEKEARELAEQQKEKEARELAEQQKEKEARGLAEQQKEKEARGLAEQQKKQPRQELDIIEDLEWPEAKAEADGKEFYSPGKAADYAVEKAGVKGNETIDANTGWHKVASDKKNMSSRDYAIHGNNPT